MHCRLSKLNDSGPRPAQLRFASCPPAKLLILVRYERCVQPLNFLKSLSVSFSEQRSELEGETNQTEKSSTEYGRLAFQRYRSFFERLLSICPIHIDARMPGHTFRSMPQGGTPSDAPKTRGAEQHVVHNKNHSGTDGGDEQAFEIESGYPRPPEAVEEPAADD